MLTNPLLPAIRKNPASANMAGAGEPRRRLLPAQRERMIVDGAVRFFSEHGLDGQLRDLAGGLGITHTLLYHYFPTKQALIERVYAEMFEGRWRSAWEQLLDDKSLDVETKLTRFYADYAKVVLERDWVRIFIFSGMSDRYITDRYFAMLREKLFPRLVRETRRFRGLANRRKPSARELELLMGLHGGIFYMGIRRWVYGQAAYDLNADADTYDLRIIRDRVRSYLMSQEAVMQAGANGLETSFKDIAPWPIH
jgi:AcrR family transcriptional regulator